MAEETPKEQVNKREEFREEFYEDEINLLDLFLVLVKRKNLILKITFFAAFITAIISLILPPVYRAETKILPPTPNTSITAQIISQLGAQFGLPESALPVKSSTDLYVELFKSRPVLDAIIDRFNLMKLYETKTREDARRVLLKKVLNVSADKKSGIITVAVEDKDPKRAADMANAFVEEFKNLTKNLALTEASQRRLFFEEQLKDTKEKLILAEEELKSFQEKTGAIKVDEQVKAVLSNIAQLKAQIAAKEAQIKVMRTYANSQNPELIKAEEELRALRAQLAALEAKSPLKNSDPLIPTGTFPKVSTEYLRKLRDLKYYETLYEILVKNYELAKIDEAKDSVLVQVIEKAIPPERKAKPKRTLMVLVATLSAFFLSIFLAFFQEYLEKASSDPENKNKLEEIKKHLAFGNKREIFNVKNLKFLKKKFFKS